MEKEDIIQESDYKKSIAKTKSLDISFNELADMYKEGELEIKPEYQRLFRWTEEEQSRFIESLILELPVPPIFVIEGQDGIYELIDGLQRVSSYLNFKGDLNIIDGTEAQEKAPLTLQGCDIIKKLNGCTFESLPKTIQIKLKRNFIRLEIISKESDNELKYHMFKRLNEGGQKLSDQEIRNCTIRMLDSTFMDFIISLSNNSDFKNTISKIDKDEINKKYDQELILRYFSQKNDIDNYSGSLKDFLTDFMEKIATGVLEFNYESEKENFEKTFKFLNKLEGKNIFSTENSNGSITDNVVIYYFDSFTIGVQKILDENCFDLEDQATLEKCKCKINELKSKDNVFGKKLYDKRTGSKTNLKAKKKIVEDCFLED